MDRSIKLNYSSTLQGSVLTLTCENEINMNATEEFLNVTCDSSGHWIPNPADFIQACSLLNFSTVTTVSPTTGIDDNSCGLLPSNQSCFRQIASCQWDACG